MYGTYPSQQHHQYAVIVLAAGYGTRLSKGISEDTTGKYAALKGLPKALVPVNGVPLIDHWLQEFRKNTDLIGPVLLVTNDHFSEKFVEWATERGIPEDHIVNDGTKNDKNRLGAICDIDLVLKAKTDIIGDRRVLIVASDLLFSQDFDLRGFLMGTGSQGDGAVVYYNVSDEDVSKRGILETGRVKVTGTGTGTGTGSEFEVVQRFLEKPSPTETASRKACPAFYVYTQRTLSLIDEFLLEKKRQYGKDNVDKFDAPGLLLAWLMSRCQHEQEHEHKLTSISIYAQHVSGRYDIGNLKQYIETVEAFETQNKNKLNAMKKSLSLPSKVVETCCARAAIMGNPSDGFNGKTLSTLISNYPGRPR